MNFKQKMQAKGYKVSDSRKVRDGWQDNYKAIKKEERGYVDELAKKYGKNFTFEQVTKEEKGKWEGIMKRMAQSIPPANTSLDKTLTKYGKNINYDSDDWMEQHLHSNDSFKDLANRFGYLISNGQSYDGYQFAELIKNSEDFGTDPDDEFYYELAKELDSIFRYGNGELKYYIDTDESKRGKGRFSDSARRVKDNANEIIYFEYGVIQLSVTREGNNFVTRVTGDNDIVSEYTDTNLLDSMALALGHVIDDGDLDVSTNAMGCAEELGLFIEAIRWNTKR